MISKVLNSFDNILCQLVDYYFAVIPRRSPKTIAPKIIAHRGVHTSSTIAENTIQSFDYAEKCNVWGIEFDVRWTKDGHPVVIHDEDCLRVFASSLKISDTTLAELKERLPLIPTLSEVILRYAPRLHLMIELKSEPYQQNFSHILYDHLSALRPCIDFHILALDPAMFSHIDQLPSHTFLPVVEKNSNAMSQIALTEDYGGITGHYLLLDNKILQKHKEHGQCVGTGFIASKNCLFREINREVEWIFTNDPEKLLSFIKE